MEFWGLIPFRFLLLGASRCVSFFMRIADWRRESFLKFTCKRSCRKTNLCWHRNLLWRLWDRKNRRFECQDFRKCYYLYEFLSLFYLGGYSALKPWISGNFSSSKQEKQFLNYPLFFKISINISDSFMEFLDTKHFSTKLLKLQKPHKLLMKKV